MAFITPQPLGLVLFSVMVSGRLAGGWENACPGCISETLRYKMVLCCKLQRHWLMGIGVQHHSVTLI